MYIVVKNNSTGNSNFPNKVMCVDKRKNEVLFSSVFTGDIMQLTFNSFEEAAGKLGFHLKKHSKNKNYCLLLLEDKNNTHVFYNETESLFITRSGFYIKKV